MIKLSLKAYQLLLLLVVLSLAGIFFLVHSPAPEPKHPVTKPTEPLRAEPSRGERERVIVMEATAYDLSIQCCGKPIGHPARGITKSGYNLNGKTRAEAMTVSSNDFPAGTELELTFDNYHSEYNGVYTVRDTGNMEPGVLDVFISDFGNQVGRETTMFGRTYVKVRVINNDK